MRTTSGSRNRVVLAIVGLCLLVGGTWLAVASTGAAARIPGLAQISPDGDTAIGTLISPPEDYLLPIVVAVTVVLGLLALWWLIVQVPSKDRTAPYRLQEDDDHGVVSVDPDVIADAVEDELAEVPGVARARADLAGSAQHPELLVRVTLEPRSSVDRVLEAVYGHLVRDLQVALETPLEHVAVQLDVGREATENTRVSSRALPGNSPEPVPAGTP